MRYPLRLLGRTRRRMNGHLCLSKRRRKGGGGTTSRPLSSLNPLYSDTRLSFSPFLWRTCLGRRSIFPPPPPLPPFKTKTYTLRISRFFDSKRFAFATPSSTDPFSVHPTARTNPSPVAFGKLSRPPAGPTRIGLNHLHTFRALCGSRMNPPPHCSFFALLCLFAFETL